MLIDLNRIVSAEEYYTKLGYERFSVPWIVGDEAYSSTKPPQAGKDFSTLGGNLVASGEQSFIQLLLDGTVITKAQCTTPCFRDEIHDEWHFPYFMKTELINLEVNINNLTSMVNDALKFFSQYLPVKVIDTGDFMVDIIDEKCDIELGSYGIRTFKNYKWIYGTGLAEPRLTQALEKTSWW